MSEGWMMKWGDSKASLELGTTMQREAYTFEKIKKERRNVKNSKASKTCKRERERERATTEKMLNEEIACFGLLSFIIHWAIARHTHGSYNHKSMRHALFSHHRQRQPPLSVRPFRFFITSHMCSFRIAASKISWSTTTFVWGGDWQYPNKKRALHLNADKLKGRCPSESDVLPKMFILAQITNFMISVLSLLGVTMCIVRFMGRWEGGGNTVALGSYFWVCDVRETGKLQLDLHAFNRLTFLKDLRMMWEETGRNREG